MAKKIGSLFVEFSATVDKFMSAFNKAEKGMARVGRRWTTIGQQMSVGISLPLAAIGKTALSAAADFEASMNKVSALGDITGTDLQSLTNQALELGKKTQFSAKQAADGMADLAAAGYNTTQIMAAMPGVLDLAAAAQVGVAEASEIAVTTMGAFHLGAEKSGEVADILASASAKGVLSITDLAEAMKYVGPVSYATGRSLEETAGAISLLSNAGIKGSQAGTALRMGMIRFIKPTKQAQEVISALGLTLTDGAGKIKPLVDIIGQLSAKNANLADVTKLVGVEAATAWMALVDQGAPALDALTQAIDRDNGAAARMAATLRQGLKGGFEQMSGSIETASIALGLALAPAILRAMELIQALADKVTDWATAFKELSPTTQNVVVGLLAFVTAAGPLLAILGPIVTGFSLVVGGVKLFAGALLALLTPAGLVIAAIGALSVAAVLIYENWGGIKQFFSDLWDTVAQKTTTNIALMRESWDQFWHDFQNGCTVIKQFAGEMLQAIIDFVDKSIEYIEKLGAKIKDALVGEFGRTVDQIKGLTEDVSGFFFDMYDKVVGHSYVPDMVKEIQKHVQKLEGPAMYTPIKQATEKSAESFVEFKDKANKSLDEVAQKAKQTASELSSQFSQIGQMFGLDSESSNIAGDFFGSILSGQKTGSSGGGMLAEMLGSLVGESGSSGLSDIATSLGETFGFDFGSAAGQDASKAIGQNMDGSLIFAEGGEEAMGGAMSSMGDYVTIANDLIESYKKLSGDSRSVAEGAGSMIGTAIGAWFGGSEGAALGGKIGEWAGKAVGMTFGGRQAETLARHNIEMFLEDVLAKANVKVPDGMGGLKDLKNVIFGSKNRFDDGTWADQFKAMGDEAFTVFNGLGIGLQKVLGVTEDVGGQIGFILAQNLSGNIDAARSLFQALGIDVKQFEDALVQAGESGEMSWHEVEVAMQGIHEAAKPGLESVGAYNDAFQRLIDTGGRGKEAIVELKNVAIEAKEAGVKTLDELKAKMMADARFTPEQINALFQALSQRGITSLDQLADASSRTGGGIVADMESLGVAFADVTAKIDQVTEAINKTPDNTEKNIHYNFTSSFDANTQAAKDGGLFDGAGVESPDSSGGINEPDTAALSTRARSTPRVLAATIQPRKIGRSVDTGGQGGNNVSVYVNAPNSTHGSEMRIRQVVMSMKDNIVRDAARFAEDRHRRSAR